MTQLLFVQGAGEDAHDDWDSKLVLSPERALGDGYDIRYPRMPNEADPRYAEWKAALLDAFEALEEGAILVGHSVGAAVLIHLLAEQPPMPKPAAIMLIAVPFIGEGGWPSDDVAPRTDFAERLPVDVPLFLYQGTADETVPVDHARRYAESIPRATVHLIAGRDHQLNDDLREVARDIRSLAS
jgi:predicted alpha/beta hydrolase family esterase